MSGPWEKYRAAPVADGPWAKYAKQEPPAPAAATQPAAQDFRGEGGGRGTSLEAALIGARQGVTFGFGDEINAGVRAAGDWLGGKVGLSEPTGYGEAYDARLAHERGLLEQTREENPVSSVAGEVGGAVLPALLTGGASAPMSVGRGAAIGAGGSGLYGFGESEGGLVERAKDAGMSAAVGGALGGGTTAVVNAIMGRGAKTAAARAVPSVDDLKADAGALYQAAQRNGVTATQAQTQGLSATMSGIARNEGLISPTGRVSAAYPKVTEALKMVDDYAKGVMTPEQMQQVRKTFQAAAKSADPQESRVGTMMIREFDDFVGQLAPEFREANALYAKAMKGDMIDTAIELAGSQAGTFSGSGYENALRTQFRVLDRKIIKGQLKGLSDAEIDGIRRVANGGPVENTLRDLGRLAPTGPVSLGVTGGVPFMVGNAFGGPALGTGLGAGAVAAGWGGRKAATAMQSRNAEIASALLRSGGQLPAQTPSPAQAMVIEALIGAQRPLAGR